MYNYYEIKITGKDIRRFIKTLYRMKVQLHKIKWEDSSVILWIDQEGFKKIKEIKTIYRIDIIGYHGLLKLEYYVKKYYFFLISMAIGILLILFLSHLIFR